MFDKMKLMLLSVQCVLAVSCLFSTQVWAISIKLQEDISNYGAKLDECSALARSNDNPFPVTPWFSTLSREEKKGVILFLSFDNKENCSAEEKATLRATAELADGQVKEPLRFLLKDSNYKAYVGDLDMQKIRDIQMLYPEPFDSFKIGEMLGIIEN